MSDETLPLQRIWHWERTRGREIYLSQPMGGGVIRDFTWAEAVGEARRMASHLAALGYPPGSRIGILSKNSAWWILADFAIWMAGHVSVPLYPTLAARTIGQIVEHSGMRLCFVGKLDGWEQMKPGLPAALPCIALPLAPPTDYPQWQDLVAKAAPLAGTPVRPRDELATIIYTSGTTGMPKGVMHSFATMTAAAQSILTGFGVDHRDRLLSYLPLSHVAERSFVEMGSVATGMRVYFAESLDTFAADLRRARPTLFFSVPRLWVKFQQGIFAKMPKEKLDRLFKIPVVSRLVKRKILRALGLDSVRFAFGGAAPMPAPMLAWYKTLGLELLEVYGMTENFGCSHGSFPGRGRPGYVGGTWPQVECKLSESGEVLTKGPTTMLGYYAEPEKTRETFTADGWLRTGDLGAFDEEGRLRITGRAKELFKTSKGKYVAPAPIENKLGSHPKIEACCVTGENYGQPFALAMLSADALQRLGEPAAREELGRSLAEHLDSINQTLDPHEQMDFIAVVKEQWTVENGLITPTLKVKRNEVEKTYVKSFDRWLGQRRPVVWAE